ncbi:LIM/homeobox protein Lhx9-like isoform X2 [Artemia franciscana]|uniref:LIM/homeobox protein Lhx9-like isoform X2 n=1 Tax=Artemia franciscana TaxID=6661 RepID=UPI0032DA9875
MMVSGVSELQGECFEGSVKKEEDAGGPNMCCGGCGGPIADRFYLSAVERPWHGDCLRCSVCSRPLAGSTSCFARGSNIYCRDDYYRLHGIRRCGRCGLVLGPNDLVMRARDFIYHLSCFTCAACNQSLTKGDIFGMRDGVVYCRLHFDMLQHGGGSFSPNDSLCGDMPHGIVPRHLLQHQMDMMSPDLSGIDGLSGYESSGGQVHGNSQRTKRMRTSFKHHQLRTMKSYFAINQNPDAKDLKQLAQKTGLSKRVLQVWFQNARAKWRRNVLRQQDSPGNMTSNMDSSSVPPPSLNLNLASPSSYPRSSSSDGEQGSQMIYSDVY